MRERKEKDRDFFIQRNTGEKIHRQRERERGTERQRETRTEIC